MKRWFKLLLVMFVLYFIIQGILKIFGNGHYMEYSVPLNEADSVTIEETYLSNTKDEKDNYYWKIKVNDKEYHLQTYVSFGHSAKVVKEVRYYKGTYECIYPVFKGKKQVMDVLCFDQGTLKNYTNIKGLDAGLDAFVSKLTEQKLYVDQFQDQTTDYKQENEMKVYSENIVDNQYIAVNSYLGLYTINNRNSGTIYEIKLFTDDVYERNLTALAGVYYVSPNYSQEYDFNSLETVNITNNKKDAFSFNFSISYNSYIQGVVDQEIYLIDKSNKKQYKINPKKKTVVEIGNETTPTQYYNRGTWSELSIYDVINSERYFNTDVYQVENTNYAKVDKVGNQKSGYIYYYQIVNNQYDVYRANVQSPTQLKYIFTTTDINHITYVDDYVYYYNGNTLHVYQDRIGNRTIYVNREYEFNKTLNYYVYKK